MRTWRWLLVATVAAFAWLGAQDLGARDKTAKKRAEVERRLQDFADYLIDFQSAPDRSIPSDLLRDCKGILIFRQFKAGFGIGVKGGGGVAMMRRADGSWSPPAFFKEGGGSIGFQIGAHKVEAIYLIMNDDGMNMLLDTRFTIGADAAATAGPVGREGSAKVGPGTALLGYSRTEGLFAGAKIEGGAMVNNDDANTALYGRPLSTREILMDPATPFPPEAAVLVNTINRYAAPPVTTALE